MSGASAVSTWASGPHQGLQWPEGSVPGHSLRTALACVNAVRAGVLRVQACRASNRSLLVGSALHSHCSASAMLSLQLLILLSRRGVIVLRTTWDPKKCVTMPGCLRIRVHVMRIKPSSFALLPILECATCIALPSTQLRGSTYC